MLGYSDTDTNTDTVLRHLLKNTYGLCLCVCVYIYIIIEKVSHVYTRSLLGLQHTNTSTDTMIQHLIKNTDMGYVCVYINCVSAYTDLLCAQTHHAGAPSLVNLKVDQTNL